MNRFFSSLFASMILLAGVSPSRATVEGNVEKTFAVNSGGTLVIDLNSGSIEVKSADANQVKIEVFRKFTVRDLLGRTDAAKERALLENTEPVFQQNGNLVTVKSRNRNLWNGWQRGQMNMNVRYVVSVPPQYHADLKTSGGGIQVDGLNGKLKAHTSGGSLKFSHIHGAISGHTSGGNISLSHSVGPIRLDTTGGGIDLTANEGAAFVETSGGSIHVKGHNGDLTAHTNGGGITADSGIL